MQNNGTIMHFLDQNLKNKKTIQQLKYRNIMNEILWIYGIFLCSRGSTAAKTMRLRLARNDI